MVGLISQAYFTDPAMTHPAVYTEFDAFDIESSQCLLAVSATALSRMIS